MRTFIILLALTGCAHQVPVYPGEDPLCPGLRNQEAYWTSRGNATLVEMYRIDMRKYGCRR